jgi:hypothetical protein
MILVNGNPYGLRSGNNCPRNLYLVPWQLCTAAGYRGQRDNRNDQLAGQVDRDEQAALIVAAVADKTPTMTGGLGLPWAVDADHGRILLDVNGSPLGILPRDVADQVVALVNRHHAAFLGACTSCNTPYDECPITDDDAEWDTDENGNHTGLCCEDCEHLAPRP